MKKPRLSWIVQPAALWNIMALRSRMQSPARSANLRPNRSEEHTSELQSRVDLVCRLLLEKKKKKKMINFTDSSVVACDGDCERDEYDITRGGSRRLQDRRHCSSKRRGEHFQAGELAQSTQ